MKRCFSFVMLFVLLFLLVGSAFSQTVPQVLNFQGRLATPSGNPVPDAANQSLTFRLFSAASGGALLWQQTSSNVAVKNGTFAASLNFASGYQNSNNLTTVFGNPLFTPFLEVQVGSDTPLAPRQPFASVAYSLYAGTALAVPDASITLNKLASGVLSFSSLSGSLTLAQIPDGLITGNKIANNTIPVSKLFPSLQDVLNRLSLIPATTGLALLGSATTQNGPLWSAVSGNYVYVTNQSADTMQIFDVSNPFAPSSVASIGTRGYPVGIVTSGNFAYVVSADNNHNNAYNSSLQIFDISVPTAPVLKSSLSVGNNTNTVAVSGNTVCTVSVGTYTLQVFDVSNPANPVLKSSIATANYPSHVAMSSNFAYVINQQSNVLQIFDVSDTAHPTLKGSVSTGSLPVHMTVSGNIAYVVSHGSHLLELFDVSNATAPVLKGSVNTGTGLPHAVAVSGNVACVSNEAANALRIFDVSNSANPTLVDAIATGVNPIFLCAAGNNVYVPCYNAKSLQIFSINRMKLKVSCDLVVTGNVGIGTTTPAYKLDVSGSINASGTVRANGVVLSSDARYKTNVQPFDNALDSILNLRGVSYEWDRAQWKDKGFGEGRQFGFIAQELEKIFPELVITDTNGYKSVNYTGVVPVLVEAIKTQNQKIETLSKENADLRATLTELFKRVETLETTGKR